MEVHCDLIYDVGLLDGEDTSYYLFRGFRVVAVDANPLMIERARLRFSKEILAGRLTLLNVAIARTAGTATFWVSDVPEWSSTDENLASRGGVAHRSIAASAVPFSQILAEYGVPHYLKIDIEGSDGLCIEALSGGTLPKYISVEAECVGRSTLLPEEKAVATLELLRDAGYRRFKLVNQSTLAPAGSDIADFCMHVVTSAARGRLRVPGMSRIANRFTEPARLAARLGFVFTPGYSSGPWGDDIRGPWMTFEKARSMYLRKRRILFSPKRDWHDWHATY